MVLDVEHGPCSLRAWERRPGALMGAQGGAGQPAKSLHAPLFWGRCEPDGQTPRGPAGGWGVWSPATGGHDHALAPRDLLGRAPLSGAAGAPLWRAAHCRAARLTTKAGR